MAIDLNNLSSEELFELARQRKQQEQEQAQRSAAVERAAELKKMRALIVSKHNEALAATDQALADLQKKRSKQLEEYEVSLTPIDRELRELAEKTEKTERTAAVVESKTSEPSAPPPAPTPLPAPTPVPAAVKSSPAHSAELLNSPDELFIHVRELMLGRTYISESLLKEQLRSRSVTVNNLHKLLEQLVKDGRLTNKGGGNYALGRKA